MTFLCQQTLGKSDYFENQSETSPFFIALRSFLDLLYAEMFSHKKQL